MSGFTAPEAGWHTFRSGQKPERLHDAVDDGGTPGYCACCREFHLLTRREVPALTLPVDVCRYCADLGDAEIAWRVAGVTEDGYGWEDAPDPLRSPRRRRSDLPESLLLDEPGFSGFTEIRPGLAVRARIAWLRLRGRP